MRRLFGAAFAVAVAAASLCLLSGCANMPMPKTPQEYFDASCGYANIIVPKAEQLLPLVTAKLGDDGTLAVQSGLAFVKTTCAKPLDIKNAAAVTQRIYDVAGEVLALVVKATTT